MPAPPRGVNPAYARAWGEAVSQLLARTETQLWALIAQNLTQAPAAGYDLYQLGQLQRLQATAANYLNGEIITMRAAITKIIDHAQTIGLDAADLDAARLGLTTVTSPLTLRAVGIIAADTLTAISGIYPTALRSIADTYQQIAASPVTSVVTGTQTITEATQSALTEAAARGLAGFTDKSGRKWSMDAYAEMSIRTGLHRVTTQAYLAGLDAVNLNLVKVTDNAFECDLCRPWENSILTTRPTADAVQVEDATDYKNILTVKPRATVDQAREQGLFHPNCTHRLVAYLPGASYARPKKDDAQTYHATQMQRAIERQIRKAERMAAAAVTPAAKKQATARLEHLQNKMALHIAKHPKLSRKYTRETDVRLVKPDRHDPRPLLVSVAHPKITTQQVR